MVIVCGTDFSPNAARAADAAAALAGALGTSLELAHVVDAFWRELPESAQGPLFDEVRRRLGAEVERLGQRGVPVREVILSGLPDEALVSHAEASHARLLVVSSMGRRPPARWLVGSVAERTAQTSPIPVLVVRESSPFQAWGAGKRSLRLLVGADFSTNAEAALGWVAELRAAGPCDVVVAYSAWPPGERERAGPDDPNLDLLRRDLERAVGRLPGAGDVKIRVEPTFGRASSHLVGMASDEAADLIVVGTHQRSGIAQLWHGSVSRGVLHEAPMSVACVPPPRRSGTAVGSASAGG